VSFHLLQNVNPVGAFLVVKRQKFGKGPVHSGSEPGYFVVDPLQRVA